MKTLLGILGVMLLAVGLAACGTESASPTAGESQLNWMPCVCRQVYEVEGRTVAKLVPDACMLILRDDGSPAPLQACDGTEHSTGWTNRTPYPPNLAP